MRPAEELPAERVSHLTTVGLGSDDHAWIVPIGSVYRAMPSAETGRRRDIPASPCLQARVQLFRDRIARGLRR